MVVHGLLGLQQCSTVSCPDVQQFTLSLTWIWPESAELLPLVKILLARDWSRTALEAIFVSCREGKVLAIWTSCVLGHGRGPGFVLFIGVGLSNELCLIKLKVLKKDWYGLRIIMAAWMMGRHSTAMKILATAMYSDAEVWDFKSPVCCPLRKQGIIWGQTLDHFWRPFIPLSFFLSFLSIQPAPRHFANRMV